MEGEDMDFGKKVKRLREDMGLTQTELADKLGVSLKTISRYEVNGMRPRNREMYNELANLFKVDASYLLVDENDYKVPLEDQNIDMLVNSMLGLFAGGTLKDRDKKAVVEAITEAYYKSKFEDGGMKENEFF